VAPEPRDPRQLAARGPRSSADYFIQAGHHYTPFASLPNEAVVRNSITFKSASKSSFFTTIREYRDRIML
jgi:hypothetical protein